MTIGGDDVSIGTSLTTVHTYTADQDLIIQNDSAGSVRVGGSDVTSAANGIEIATGEVLTVAGTRGEVLYGITATTAKTVHIMWNNGG